MSISMVVILAILVQYVDGNQRIVHVNQLTVGEDDNACCVYSNCSCSCSSFDHALANLTSNVLINITTDVTLSSLYYVSDIENVTIFGHKNPTVRCQSFGGIHFTFCHNCIIESIIWYGCGVENTEPVVLLSNSSNITIKNCVFQHSKGQAVLLTEISGDANINHCNFVHNNCFRGHGAAIHYSSSNVTNCHQDSVFTINNCNFTYNNYAKSLVYIENKISTTHNNNINFFYTEFHCNQGISLYAVNHNIYLNGKHSFQHNIAENGTGIYISDHYEVPSVPKVI